MAEEGVLLLVWDVYGNTLSWGKLGLLVVSVLLGLRWLVVGMHAFAVLKRLGLLLFLGLDAVFLLLGFFSFLVVEALAGLHIFFAPDGLLGWIVVDIGSKRSHLLHF